MFQQNESVIKDGSFVEEELNRKSELMQHEQSAFVDHK
jgi:hypothetical protein